MTPLEELRQVTLRRIIGEADRHRGPGALDDRCVDDLHVHEHAAYDRFVGLEPFAVVVVVVVQDLCKVVARRVHHRRWPYRRLERDPAKRIDVDEALEEAEERPALAVLNEGRDRALRRLHSVLTIVAPPARFDDGLRGVDFDAVFDRCLVTAEPKAEGQCRTNLMTRNDPVEAVALLQRLGVGVESDRVSRK